MLEQSHIIITAQRNVIKVLHNIGKPQKKLFFSGPATKKKYRFLKLKKSLEFF